MQRHIPDIQARSCHPGALPERRPSPPAHRHGPPPLWAPACLAVACLVALIPAQGHTQVLQVWTHKAAFGDASAAVGMGDTLIFVANNENEVLSLYSRHTTDSCHVAIGSFNARPFLGPTGSDSTADLESAVRLGGRIYWLGGLGNNKNGTLRPNRDRFFATLIGGNGSGSPPYSLSYLGRYDKLREDIIAWDVGNHHGLGANYFGLAASAASNVAPQLVNGFNVEGLTVGPDGHTAYIGFRAPLVNPSGPTTSNSPRTHALIIPLVNVEALVTGNPTPGPGAAVFGTPILLPLGSRGIRSIDYTRPGQYLITAGPTDAVSNPPVAPLDFRLFTWSGYPASQPVERVTTFDASFSPEACVLPDQPITAQTIAEFVSDDGGGNGCWRNMTATVGLSIGWVDVPPPRDRPGAVRFSRPPAPNPAQGGVTFTIAVPKQEFVDLSICDLAGRRVASLWHGELAQGERSFAWDGAAAGGGRAGAGVYWVRLRGGTGAEVRRFVLMR
jgi:hypothetical protein